jgi:hypothetical protein
MINPHWFLEALGGNFNAQIAVESLNYCAKSHCLASVAEKAGSVRLWDVLDEGDFGFLQS